MQLPPGPGRLESSVLEVELSDDVQQDDDYGLTRMHMLLRMTERFQALRGLLIALWVPHSTLGLGRIPLGQQSGPSSASPLQS